MGCHRLELATSPRFSSPKKLTGYTGSARRSASPARATTARPFRRTDGTCAGPDPAATRPHPVYVDGYGAAAARKQRGSGRLRRGWRKLTEALWYMLTRSLRQASRISPWSHEPSGEMGYRGLASEMRSSLGASRVRILAQRGLVASWDGWRPPCTTGLSSLVVVTCQAHGPITSHSTVGSRNPEPWRAVVRRGVATLRQLLIQAPPISGEALPQGNRRHLHLDDAKLRPDIATWTDTVFLLTSAVAMSPSDIPGRRARAPLARVV
jgi:hypothetical protein